MMSVFLIKLMGAMDSTAAATLVAWQAHAGDEPPEVLTTPIRVQLQAAMHSTLTGLHRQGPIQSLT